MGRLARPSTRLTSIMRSSLLGRSANLICLTATASPVLQLKALYTDPKAPLPRHSPNRCKGVEPGQQLCVGLGLPHTAMLGRGERRRAQIQARAVKGEWTGEVDARNPSVRGPAAPRSRAACPCETGCRVWRRPFPARRRRGWLGHCSGDIGGRVASLSRVEGRGHSLGVRCGGVTAAGTRARGRGRERFWRGR